MDDSKRGGDQSISIPFGEIFPRAKIIAVELTETEETGFPYLSV